MSGRKRRPAATTSVAWLWTFSDLVTLLMAFFVVMFAVSQVEESKFEAFLSGLGHFNNSAAEPGVWPANSELTPMPIIGPNDSLAVAGGAGVAAQTIVDLRRQREVEAIENRLTEALEGVGMQGSFQLRTESRGVAVVIATDDVLFQVGSAALTPDGAAIVDVVASVLREVPYPIAVEGHADNTPLNRGSYTNLNLSSDRALTVAQDLIHRHRLPADRFSTAGFGEHKPVDPSDTAEARAKNRRVEIVILTNPSPDASTAKPGEKPAISLPPVDVFGR